jgi:hypothetical protein
MALTTSPEGATGASVGGAGASVAVAAGAQAASTSAQTTVSIISFLNIFLLLFSRLKKL